MNWHETQINTMRVQRLITTQLGSSPGPQQIQDAWLSLFKYHPLLPPKVLAQLRKEILDITSQAIEHSQDNTAITGAPKWLGGIVSTLWQSYGNPLGIPLYVDQPGASSLLEDIEAMLDAVIEQGKQQNNVHAANKWEKIAPQHPHGDKLNIVMKKLSEELYLQIKVITPGADDNIQPSLSP